MSATSVHSGEKKTSSASLVAEILLNMGPPFSARTVLAEEEVGQ